MGYLERNAEICKVVSNKVEAGDIVFVRNNLVLANASDTTTFTPLGKIEIDTARLHLGLKAYSNKSPGTRHIFDLAAISAISDTLPIYRREVPVFFGLVTSEDGGDIGILMEDFSEGGARSVNPVYEDMEDWLPTELRNLIPQLTNRQLADTAFNVARERRLGDFDGLAVGLKSHALNAIFPIDEIYDRKKEFTVFVPRDSIK